ncbi:MAG: hypothetical protein AAFS10_06220 [Myxococcota bacterium]
MHSSIGAGHPMLIRLTDKMNVSNHNMEHEDATCMAEPSALIASSCPI